MIEIRQFPGSLWLMKVHISNGNFHQFPVDMSGVQGQLLDPTVTLITWGPRKDGKRMRDGGAIYKTGEDKPRLFWDPELLAPYLAAWHKRRDELLPAA